MYNVVKPARISIIILFFFSFPRFAGKMKNIKNLQILRVIITVVVVYNNDRSSDPFGMNIFQKLITDCRPSVWVIRRQLHTYRLGDSSSILYMVALHMTYI